MFSSIPEMYYKMPDGTIKQINPFTGTEVWYVPERDTKPIYNLKPKEYKRIRKKEKEDYCHFCEANYLFTPPEKSRFVLKNGQWEKYDFVLASKLFETTAEFRRIPNLFEIVTYQYWVKNYNYKMPAHIVKWKKQYLAEKEGREHVLNMIDLKFRVSGKEEELKQLSEKTKLELAEGFFGGSHELIIGRRHYKDDAIYDYELCSAGELTSEEHYQYIKFTIETMQSIKNNNEYARYISIFQNWLAPAGASFDHLHKQLVALDEWGVAIEREIQLIRQNKNIYNEFAANFAAQHNLLIAENDFAVAFADIGHRFPTIALYSKSQNIRPFEHQSEEIRGLSDLLHSIHKAMTGRITCNEEWYYTPFDSVYNMPWHILIKWRTNTPAGFEGNTKIYINPISPEKLRDMMIKRLFELRAKKEIPGNILIGDECPKKTNKLKYYLRGA